MASCKIVVGLLLLTDFITTTFATPTTCIADTCAEGERTFITCLFHKDISVSKQGINVLRYRLNATGISEETDVLQCMWQTDQDTPDCIVEKGYDFDNVISDRLRLEVISASESVAGFYACNVVPQGDFHPHACFLTVNNPRRVNIPSSRNWSDDKVKPIKSSPRPNQDTDCSGERTALAVTASLCVLLILAVVFTFVYFKIWRKTRTRFEQRSKNAEGGFSEDTESLLQVERCTSTCETIAAEEGDGRGITTGVQNPIFIRPSYMKVNCRAVTLNDQNRNLLSFLYSEKAHTYTESIPFSNPRAPGMCYILRDESGRKTLVKTTPAVPDKKY